MRISAHSAKDLAEAVEEAELQLKRPEENNTTVNLSPTKVKVRPELFQPREFALGLRDTDPEHVKKLRRAISSQGELDPIVVIKLGTKFVCVDGHHRIAAYKQANWTQPIKCEWFAGSVREAVDESMRLNAKDRLNIPKEDKYENAWKRTLLGWGSKAEVVKLCGVGDGTVAHMRRLANLANENSERGEEFRRRLGFSVKKVSWYQAKLAEHGLEREAIDAETKAEQLARRIRARLEDLLSRDPEVTARALELYDPDLPKRIAMAWLAGAEKANEETTVTERDDGEEALVVTDAGLRLTLDRRRKQVAVLEAEQERRANGGVPSDAAQDVSSDAVWASWTERTGQDP